VSVSLRGSEHPGSDPLRTVVWLSGDHDITTRDHLAATIARAARLDGVDMVIDLSGVTFMDASTIGVIVDAHNRLRARSHSLSVRSPPRVPRRLLDVCDLAFLIDEQPAPPQPRVAPALDSWVAVPATGRASEPAPGVTEEGLSRETTRTAEPRRGEPAESAPQSRTPS